MKPIVIVISLLLLSLNVLAQQEFQSYYSFNSGAMAERVLEIPGTGYFTIGWCDSLAFDSAQNPTIDYIRALITKLDYHGDTVKTVQLGREDTIYSYLYGDDSNDAFRSAIISPDKKIVVAGVTQSYDPESFYDYDLWLLKIDTNLDTLWTKRLSLPDTAIDLLGSVAKATSNGGIAIPGGQSAFSNGLPQGQLTVFDSSGNLVFHQRILEHSYSKLSGVAQTSDGGFLCSGIYYNNICQDDMSPLLIKLDSMGNEQWHYTLPYTGNTDLAEVITKTQDGNYVYTWGSALNYNLWIYHATKIDEQGNTIWTKDYTYTQYMHLRVTELPNSNLMFSGVYNDTLGTGMQALLILCDSNGNTIWTRMLNGIPGLTYANWPLCFDGSYTSDGGFILSGQIQNIIHLSTFSTIATNLWILKTDSLGLITNASNNIDSNLPLISLGEIYPNPTSSKAFLSTIIPPNIDSAFLLLFDIQGRQLIKINVENGLNQTMIDLSQYPNGEYLIALALDGYNAGTQKVFVKH